MNRLAETYTALKDFDKSIPAFEKLLVLQNKLPGSNPFAPLRTMQSLAISYAEAGRVDDLRRVMKEYLAKQWAALPAGRTGGESPLSSVDDGLLARLGDALLRRQQYGPAEEYVRECLKIREANKGDPWRTASARALLGAALAGQKRYQDAAPLLLQGYEGLRKEGPQIAAAVRHERLTVTAEWLLRLYEAWDKQDEANVWRQKLDELKAAPKKP
jgi:tetratricopeptide (TPR) repeat protein